MPRNLAKMLLKKKEMLNNRLPGQNDQLNQNKMLHPLEKGTKQAQKLKRLLQNSTRWTKGSSFPTPISPKTTWLLPSRPSGQKRTRTTFWVTGCRVSSSCVPGTANCTATTAWWSTGRTKTSGSSTSAGARTTLTGGPTARCATRAGRATCASICIGTFTTASCRCRLPSTTWWMTTLLTRRWEDHSN